MLFYSVPIDQTKPPRFETFIIHCSDDESLLFSPKDLDSWKSLLKAATIRNHRLLLDLAENVKEGEIPHVSYHRKWRSLFTIKRDLESISQTAAAASQIPEFNKQRSRREEPSTTRTHPKICIFCQKTTAYKKVARTRDPLTQCVDLRVDASIRKAAIAAGDGRIIGLASPDFVTPEAYYHSQCYRDYNQTDKACKYSDLDETNYCDIESQASDKLYELIRLNLLENPRLVKKVDLREKLMIYMQSMGATEISESTKKTFPKKVSKRIR